MSHVFYIEFIGLTDIYGCRKKKVKIEKRISGDYEEKLICFGVKCSILVVKINHLLAIFNEIF